MKQCIKWFSITLVALIVSIQSVIFFLPKPSLLDDLSYSRAILDDQGHLLRLTLSTDDKYRLKTSISQVSSNLINATLLQEDQYFYWHLGINPFSIIKACWDTYVIHSRRVGASTITMQVARIRFKLHSRTLFGKLWQMFCALQLESYYTKQEILDAYLTLAPYGNNIEGIEAASYIYFGKPAKALSLPEILTLVIIPQNPTKRPFDKVMLKNIRQKLFLRWVAVHPRDKTNTALINLPLQMREITKVPFLAPHFVNDLLANFPYEKNIINTTLNFSLQRLIEQVTRNYLSRHINLGINNASVVLVDTRTMEIKSLLGSADFFNSQISGQVNGTEIKRSPGSTLKPFIYALALDQSLIHPATLLKDVPRSFGSYNPENFDNDFVGPIKATDALILSRNVPAVFLADQLKHPTLHEFLQQAGIRELKSETYYGLALVLGGAELTMQELVSLYATLANRGVWQPLHFLKNQPEEGRKRLLSKEASFLTLDMLKKTSAPGKSYGYAKTSYSVAWKTGTSSGYRDAWTLGVIGPYVLGVWIGNFNNQSNHAFVGKEIAAPLFFEIVAALSKQFGNFHDEPHTENLNLARVDVCKVSGMLPTRYCDETEKVWFIPGKSPIKTDHIHREVAIDPHTGLRACHFDHDTQFQIYEFWSSDLLKIFKRAGIKRRLPPAYDSSCTVGLKDKAGFSPQIVSPQKHLNYIARISTSNNIIPFSAIVDADVTSLYWFLNETFIGKVNRDQSLMWHAHPGSFVVRVVDDYGRSHAMDLHVKAES